MTITAIDVLLEPDATMLAHAEAANARLLEVFPKGFALDEAHRPHITLIQCFVPTQDLEGVYGAAAGAFATADLAAISLEAFKGYTVPAGEVGLAGIVARTTPALLQLQQAIVDALAPFTLPTGPIEAFTAHHGNPAFDQALIDYVASFVPAHTGERFSPPVTTGVAPTAVLDAMLAEPFAPFTFSPVGAAVYQLGPFGTAARRLSTLA